MCVSPVGSFKETLSNKHFLFRFLIFLLQQVHITILITEMQKKIGGHGPTF